MQNLTKPVLVCTAIIFFAAIFVLACVIQVDIVTPLPYDVVVVSSNLKDNDEAANNETGASTASKVVCYLTVSSGNDSTWDLDPGRIDPFLCTHLIVGFASVVNCTMNLGGDVEFYKRATKLKLKNPELKVMISVGGMNEISSGFPEMTRNHSNRKIFIRSTLAIAKNLSIDGIDVDWEFPAWLDTDGRQRIHYIQLLQEMKRAFQRNHKKLILSAAVAASEAIIDQCYNVPEIAEHVDFVNLMAYDFHFYSLLLPLTGFNSPLYSNPSETGLWLTLNVNYSTNYWVEKGMPRDKIVVGIPTYGHSFRLDNADNHGLASPCNGYGSLGSGGFVSYPLVCSFLQNGATKVFQNQSRVPYAFKDTEWISYDDASSVAEKANWVRSSGFGGGMVFSLNTDDWNASCDGKSLFPLTRIISNKIKSN